MSTIKLERVTSENSKVPQLKITLSNGKKGYLAPRKAYQFQVSGSVDGEWDFGSSEVVGLGNIVLAFNNYKQPEGSYSAFAGGSNSVNTIFNAFAKNAFDNFVRLKADDNSAYLGYEEQELWNQYISDCVTYVTELVAVHLFKEAM